MTSARFQRDFPSIMASGLQKYPAYGSLQKDIAEPWPVGRWRECFGPSGIPFKIMWTKTEVQVVSWKCCDFINVMCFIVLSASSSGNVSSCLMLIQIGQHLRSMRESKRKRFFSPMAQIKVGFLSGVFRVSWARTRLFFGMDGLPPRSIRKKNSCRDTDEFEIVWDRNSKISAPDEGIDLVVRCCCEKGSEVTDSAEVLILGAIEMLVNILPHCNESVSTSLQSYFNESTPFLKPVVFCRTLGVFYNLLESLICWMFCHAGPPLVDWLSRWSSLPPPSRCSSKRRKVKVWWFAGRTSPRRS